MKLISCYVEQFGGLRQFSVDFETGITQILQPNGFGKTTLAEFLRAMFYGFPRKWKNLKKDRRQHYLPWDGSQASGNLVFEHEGVRYRLERSFGAEPKNDTFKLIDLETNRKSVRFSKDIGQELFGLDADSFERSTYFPQNFDVLELNTAAISAKLNELVEGSGDVAGFEKAMEALYAKRTTYLHYRGEGGSACDAREQMTQAQLELDKKQALLKDLPQLIEHLEKEKLEHAQRLEQLRGRKEQMERSRFSARHEQEYLKSQYQQTLEEKENLENDYPGGIPEEAQLQSFAQLLQQEALLKAAEIPVPEIQPLHVPTAEQWETAENCCDALLNAQRKLDLLQFQPEEQLRYEELKKQHLAGRLDLQRLENLEDLYRQAQKIQNKKRIAPTVISAVLTVVFLAAALVGMMLLQGVMAWVVFGACVLCGLTAAGWLVARLQKIRKNRKIFQHAQRELVLWLGTDVPFGKQIKKLRQDAVDFFDLDARYKESKTTQIPLREEKSRLEEQLKAFLKDYEENDPVEEELSRRLRLLRQELDRKELLFQQAQRIKADALKNAEQLQLVRQQIRAFCESFSLPEEALQTQLQQLRKAQLIHQTLTARARQLKKQLDEFEVEEDPKELTDLEELLHQEQQNDRGLFQQEEKIRQLRREATQIPELEERVAFWRERMQQDMKKAELLDNTMALLQQARERLSGNYLEQLRSRFLGYLERLFGQKQRALVDSDLHVQLERQGHSRDLLYFSAGQTDLVMLCMRLALADTLFQQEKAFLILDDPFVNLDNARTEEALALLRELGKERQIIYLVCNSSRSI